MSSIFPSLSPSLLRASWPRQVLMSSVVGIRCVSFVWCVCVAGGRPSVPPAALRRVRESDAVGGAARARAAVGAGLDTLLVLGGRALGALLALLHVALDLVLVLLAAVVGGAEQVGGDLAAAEPERQRAGESEHAEQRGVGDRHDLRRDVELVE